MLNLSILNFKSRQFYVLTAVFVAVFLVGRLALAVDDGCTSVMPELRCDTNEDFCVDDRGFSWTSSGYPSGAGNAQCCGDDSQEYYKTCANYGSGVTCVGGATCASKIDDCVYNGTIYSHLSKIDTADSGSDLEICLLYDVTNAGWVDPDTWAEDYQTGNNTCVQAGFTWFSSSWACRSAGPNNVCDDADGGAFCCGDDTNEKVVPSCDGVANSACCPSTANYIDVASGNCVTSCSLAPTAPDGLDSGSFYCLPMYDQSSVPSIEIGWYDNSSNETGFKIYRNTTATKPGTAYAQVGQNVVSYTDSNLVSGTTYYYWVTAYNASGESSADGPLSRTSNRINSHVQNLRATSVTSSAITWSWDAVVGVSYYVVYTNSGSSQTTNTTFTRSGLNPSTAYYIYVMPVFSSGSGCESAWLYTTTSATTCPSNNSQSSGVDWDANSALCPSGKWGYTTGNATSGCFVGMCCADDSGESVNSRVCYNNGICVSSSNDKACCSGAGICVYNNQCYSQGVLDPLPNMSVDAENESKIVCQNGKWADLDDGGMDGSNSYCGDTLPGGVYSWANSTQIISGAFGDYTSAEQSGCCGEDDGEGMGELCPGVPPSQNYYDGSTYNIYADGGPDYCCPVGTTKVMADPLMFIEPGWYGSAYVSEPGYWYWGNTRCVVTCSAIGPTCSSAPDAPENLHHTSNTESSVSWSWSVSGGCPADSYLVYDQNGTLVDTVSSNSYTWSGLEFPNKQYGIKVVGVNSFGSSSATAVSYAYTSIERPTSLTCSSTQNSVTVTANGTVSDPSPTNQYISKIDFARESNWMPWQNSKTYTFSDLTCGGSYDVEAKTRNGDGEERSSVTTTCYTQSCSAGPDLIVTNISTNNEVCLGSSLAISAIVKNNGDQSTGATFYAGARVDGVSLDTDVMGPLTAGSTANFDVASWNSTGQSLGQHTITIEADTGNTITESNETNNTLNRTFDVINCGGTGSNNPPGAFNLLTPENNATGVSTDASLTWQTSADPDSDVVSYHIYMCEGVGCTPAYVASSAANSYTVEDSLGYNTVYRWNVLATDGTDTTNSTNGPYNFTTMAQQSGGTAPVADFNWCLLSADTVQFLDKSTPGDSPLSTWLYNFNDGETCGTSCSETGYTGTNQNPVHTFTSGSSVYSSPNFVWYSTMNSLAAVQTPEFHWGTSHGTVVGDVSFVTGKINNGAEINDATLTYDYVRTPNIGVVGSDDWNLMWGQNAGVLTKFRAKGAIVMWYKPYYAHSDNVYANLFYMDGNGGEFKFAHRGTEGLTFEMSGATNELNAPNSSYSWSANQWVKIEVRWNFLDATKYMAIYLDGVRIAYKDGLTYSPTKLNDYLYIGSEGYQQKTMGIIDEFMLLDSDAYTLTGGVTNPNVSLKVTGENGLNNTYSEELDLGSGTSCSYNLTALAAANCHTVDLSWQQQPLVVPGYDIYRSTSSSGPWTLARSGATGTTYSDYNEEINENTVYYYYITTSPISLNNSTVAPSCSGGMGSGSQCPLSVTTPICDISDYRLSTVRKCGSITFRWAAVAGAKSYEIQKSSGNNSNFSNVLTVNEGDIANYCDDNYCSYTDTEVVPVNTLNPLDKFKYWYRARAMGINDEWTNWSSEASDFSYCYRSKDWQER